MSEIFVIKKSANLSASSIFELHDGRGGSSFVRRTLSVCTKEGVVVPTNSHLNVFMTHDMDNLDSKVQGNFHPINSMGIP